MHKFSHFGQRPNGHSLGHCPVPPLMLHNTLTDRQEPFHKEDGKVSMYVCGITPYDYPHVGHGRVYVTFDVLYRLLRFLGYDVTYCRNFTDIDDKLINRAEKELNDPADYLIIANRFIEAFHEDLLSLACLSPAYEPRVTTHIGPIIAFVEGLIAAGKAYATPIGDVYYSIKSFPEYGKLSRRSIADLEAGARVAVREDKHDPLDFALWKSTDVAPGWESPWGFGRPGWHIECSAMAKAYLGETLDIHAGGMDLIFPHHENEVAQSEGLHNKIFARFWMHNAFVRINQEKMSKSLGNFVTLRDLCNRFHPMVIRYYYLIHHYRSPLDFTAEDIEGASKSYQRLCLALEKVPAAMIDEIRNSSDPLLQSMLAALCDDLTIAKFFGLLFESLSELGPNEASVIKGLINEVLGLNLVPLPKAEVVITPEIQQLLDEREAARAAKDWARSDALRDQLKILGVEVQDRKL